MIAADRQLLASDVKNAEGYSERAYQDTKGVWTIGYGTNLQELVIDHETAVKWLAKKLAESERECEQWGWYASLSPKRQRVMVELVYNMGLPRVKGFVRMLEAIRQRDFQKASAELLDSKWARDVGAKRSQRLAEMLRTG